MDSPLLDATNYLDLALRESGREACIAEKAISFTPKAYPLLHYVYSGRGTFLFQGQEHHLKAGDLFLIPAGATATYGPSPEQPWSYLWVGVGGSKAEALLRISGLDAEHPIRHDATRELKTRFEEIYESYFREGGFGLEALAALYGLFASMSRGETPRQGSERGHIASAKAFIRNNFQFQITMVDVARSVGVSPNYLANLFQKEGEGSPKSYLTKTRMEAAQGLLLTSSAPVGEVAKAVGYTSPLHFSKAFRHYTGVAPLRYRSLGGNRT